MRRRNQMGFKYGGLDFRIFDDGFRKQVTDF